MILLCDKFRTLHVEKKRERGKKREKFLKIFCISFLNKFSEFLTEQRRIRGITLAPLRAVVRLQSFSTMQTVHSTATGHESPGGMQHQLIYAPVWKSQRGDAIRLVGRLVDVTWGKSKRERVGERDRRGARSRNIHKLKLENQKDGGERERIRSLQPLGIPRGLRCN